MNSGLISGSCVTKAFNVYQNRLEIHDNKIFDISTIVSQLAVDKVMNAYKFEFWNTILKPYAYAKDPR